MKSHRYTLLILLTLVLGLSLHARQPNVVIFLTDDQGWGDLSSNGNINLSTPHIDSLATQGTTMDNFYVCSVCAPTRAEFLTGRYYPRTGVSGVSHGQGRLNPDETTIADVFKSNGYVTGAFGKWHNGTQSPYHPNDRGFDEYYGFTSGHWGHYFSPPLDHNGKPVRGKGYVVDDFTDHAIQFIEDNKEQPFFCYIPYNTPHSPMYITDEFYDKFEGKDPAMRFWEPEREDVMMTRAALAMCENIDWNVGRVLKTLDQLQLTEDTIVVFFTDNGPNSYRWNGGMKGRKGSIDEGGLRSPFLIRWSGTIPAGAKRSQVTGAIDLLPTLADLAGISVESNKPLDGKSFRPLIFDGASHWSPRSLFSIRSNQVSVRSPLYRLDAQGGLFEVAVDRGQQSDVSQRYPQIAASLKEQADQFNAEMQKAFQRYADRPFTVGFAPSTTLPARDGQEHGTIQRSVRSANNSFFKHWTDVGDSITWPIEVGTTGDYEVTVYYTCAEGDEGAVVELKLDGGHSVHAEVTEAFDPPLWDKSLERVAESHYFVKDWKPLTLGSLRLEKGTGLLRLGSLKKPGKQVIDVYSVVLRQVD